MNDGPLLEHLTARMADTPPEFLMEPRIQAAGAVPVEAVISDLLIDLGGRPLPAEALANLRGSDEKDRPRLQFLLLGAWLLHDPAFTSARRYAPAAFAALRAVSQDLAGRFDPSLVVTDPDRREEFVRLLLRGLDLRPKGEDDARALDRLQSLSSAERERVVKETREKLEKMRKMAEELKKKEAEEAAARAYRE